MILKFFNKSYFPQYLAIFLLGVAWWLPVLFSHGVQDHREFFAPANFFPDVLEHWKINGWVTFIAVYLLGYLINKLAGIYGFTDKNSTLTFLFFMAFSSLLTHSLLSFQALLILMFSYFFTFLLFSHDSQTENTVRSFDAGFVLGLTGVIYPPAIFLIVAFWAALLVIGGVSWRNLITGSLGVMAPLFAVYLYYYFSGKETLFFQVLYNQVHDSLVWLSGLTEDKIFYLGFLAVFFLLGLLSVFSKRKLSVRLRRFQLILGILIMATSIVAVLYYDPNFIAFLLPWLALISGNVFTTVEDSKRISVLLAVIFVLLLVNNLI